MTVARLVFSGVLDRHSGVKLILSHSGGAIPYLAGRLSRNHTIDGELGDPEAALQRLFFDSVVFDPSAMELFGMREDDLVRSNRQESRATVQAWEVNA